MSRMYRVTIKETVKINTQSDDRIVRDIVLQQILPQEQMVELLERSMQEKGFVQENGVYSKEIEGVRLDIDLNACNEQGQKSIQSVLQLSLDSSTDLQIEFIEQSYNPEVANKSAVEKADAIKSDSRQAAQTELDDRVSQQLEQAACQADVLMHEMLQEVYGEALKQKAAQLGTVLEQSESIDENGSYELKIRIEI
ncbi:MAG: hypothetical protein VX278_12280 [Myxococcota bacterium]|nr:hypothetical protein [Myxococcota bacterium]